MQAAWGLTIAMAAGAVISAIISGLLSYASGTVNRFVFIALTVFSGLSFVLGLVAMGLATAANNLAGDILTLYNYDGENFHLAVGWYV